MIELKILLFFQVRKFVLAVVGRVVFYGCNDQQELIKNETFKIFSLWSNKVIHDNKDDPCLTPALILLGKERVKLIPLPPVSLLYSSWSYTYYKDKNVNLEL